MIPVRVRGTLPAGHPLMIFRDPASGRLIVVLSDLLPRGLEQAAVRLAVRAWKRHERRRRGTPLAVVPGVAWVGHHSRALTATAATTVAAAGLAYAITTSVQDGAHRPVPPAASAPGPVQVQPRKVAPHVQHQHTAPAGPAVPVAAVALHAAVVPVRPGVAHHLTGGHPGRHGGGLPRVPAGPPVSVPPVHVTPPPVATPAERPLVGIEAGVGGHLADVRVGGLVHATL